jgi:hypothetical protein
MSDSIDKPKISRLPSLSNTESFYVLVVSSDPSAETKRAIEFVSKEQFISLLLTSLTVGDLTVTGEGIGLTGNTSSISTVGDYGTISTIGDYASISTIGNEAGITTNGLNASIVTHGENAAIRTEGGNASIYTEGESANIYTMGQGTYMLSGSFRLFDGTWTTYLTHEPTGDRDIALPDSDGVIALIPTGPYSNDANAAAAGIPIGGLYYHGNGVVHIRLN